MNINNNDALTNLDGLGGITSVGLNLVIIGNLALTNLDGLSGITLMGDEFKIYENDALPDCDVCDLLDQITTTPTLIDVHDNVDDTCTPVPGGCP